jgi:hypothetical protein
MSALAVVEAVAPVVRGTSGGRSVAAPEVVAPARNWRGARTTWPSRPLSEGHGGVKAHGCPRQVGPAYQKTSRPVSGPNRPSWQPTRPPEDLPEDSPRRPNSTRPQNLAYKTRQDLSGLRLKQIDGIWQDV